jgi:hypothetical protein
MSERSQHRPIYGGCDLRFGSGAHPQFHYKRACELFSRSFSNGVNVIDDGRAGTALEPGNATAKNIFWIDSFYL